MDTLLNEPEITRPAKRSWRRHSSEFKSRVIELARQPHASVAAVALANGLNANMLRRWVREAEGARSNPAADPPALDRPAFVPVTVSVVRPPTPVAPSASSQASPPLLSIAVEIHRGGTSVHANLPLDERSATWLREVLG
jgi:transposase-like protein